MSKLFIVGILLLAISGYPLYLMARELLTSQAAYDRYEVKQFSGNDYDYRTAEFRGHHVALSDSLEIKSTSTDEYLKAPITVTIDGKDYSIPNPIEVHVYHGSKSYSGEAALLNLKDRQTNEESLAFIQRVDGQNYPDDSRYRILFVHEDGMITEEWFTYGERASPMYRTVLAKFAHPEPLGFHSQVMDVWPSVFYPILYPWLTGLIGLILSIIGGWLTIRNRKRNITRKEV